MALTIDCQSDSESWDWVRWDNSPRIRYWTSNGRAVDSMSLTSECIEGTKSGKDGLDRGSGQEREWLPLAEYEVVGDVSYLYYFRTGGLYEVSNSQKGHV